jgi:hypothetical protein
VAPKHPRCKPQFIKFNQFPSPEQSPNPSSVYNLKLSISESLIQQIGADQATIRAKRGGYTGQKLPVRPHHKHTHRRSEREANLECMFVVICNKP